jgi:nucleoside-diphosphate-sugar epimerase
MRLLITGVTGFIGRWTAKIAIESGHEVFALTRVPLSHEMKALGVNEICISTWTKNLEFSDLAPCTQDGQKIDAVIHLAGDAHYGNGDHYISANVRPTQLLMAAVKELSPNSKFVYASSVGAQDFPRANSTRMHNELTPPKPRSDYGKSKLNAEALVRDSGLDFAIARLGMVIGSDMRSDSHVSVILRDSQSSVYRKVLSIFRGVLPLVDVKDVVSALLLMAEKQHPSGTYLVVDENLTISDVMNKPRGTSVLLAEKFGLGPMGMLLPAKITTALSPVMRFDSSKLRASGWVPRTKIEDTLRQIHLRSSVSKRKIQVITGVGSGLGRAFLSEIAQSDSTVIGIDRDQAAVDQLKKEFPDDFFMCSDVVSPTLFEEIQDIARNAEGLLEGLYLVAGIGRKTAFIDQEIANLRAQFEVNVLARLVLARRFLQYLRENETKGRLAIVSSSTAIQPLPQFSVYGSTNAALLSFGRSLISEVNPKLCQILIIVPGGMDTNFQSTAGVKRLEKEKLLDPSTIAQKIVKMGLRRSQVLVIGRNARIAQLLSRVLPWKVADVFWAKLTKVSR